MKRLSDRVAIVTGASRGIGRALAIRLACEGALVVVASRSQEPRPGLPGSIYTVSDEIVMLGGVALPLRTDVSSDEDVRRMVRSTIDRFGRLDILINNASALWWRPLLKTPPRRFEQMVDVSLRGSYLCLYHCLPHMVAGSWGHIINLSPPLEANPQFGRGVFAAVKAGVSRLALAVAQEQAEAHVAANTLWTYAYVESQATINWGLGDPSQWRSTDLICDAAVGILTTEPPELTGKQLIAEDFLRSLGWSDEDLEKYVVHRTA